MYFQHGEARLSDYGFWERVRIFFSRHWFKERAGNTVRYYKLYKGRKVLIYEERYEDRY